MTFDQWLKETTLLSSIQDSKANRYNESNAGEYFDSVLYGMRDAIREIRRALRETDAAKQELQILRQLQQLRLLTCCASERFLEYKEEQLDIAKGLWVPP